LFFKTPALNQKNLGETFYPLLDEIFNFVVVFVGRIKEVFLRGEAETICHEVTKAAPLFENLPYD